jgi:hypothetical protein
MRKMRTPETDHAADRVMDFCREQEAERRVSCQALVYWTALQKGRKMPPVGEVDAEAFGELRENMFIMNTGNGGGQFVIRTCGEVVSDTCGDDPRGHPVMDVFPIPLNENAFEVCTYAVASRQPMVDAGTIMGEDSKFIYRLIVMPLSDDGKSVNNLLGAFSYREVD